MSLNIDGSVIINNSIEKRKTKRRRDKDKDKDTTY